MNIYIYTYYLAWRLIPSILPVEFCDLSYCMSISERTWMANSILFSKNESDRLANRDLKTPSKITQTHYTSLLRSSHPIGGSEIGAIPTSVGHHDIHKPTMEFAQAKTGEWLPSLTTLNEAFADAPCMTFLYSRNFRKYSIGRIR